MVKRNIKLCRGFSLVELAIVIGVIGAVLAGIWTVASDAWENVRQEKAKEAITSTVRNVRAYYSGQAGISGSFSALSPLLAQANVFPGDMTRGTGVGGCTKTCIDHPWSAAGTSATGSFGVCPVDPAAVTACAAGPVPLFAVQFINLATGVCTRLLVNNTQADMASGLTDIVVNGTAYMAPGKGFPVLPSDARTLCSSASSTVSFVYSLANPGN